MFVSKYATEHFRDVDQAFKNDRQLQQFVLTGITPTGRILGIGSYGSVEVASHLTGTGSYGEVEQAMIHLCSPTGSHPLGHPQFM